MSGSTSTGSAEVSVPTDLTITSEGDSEEYTIGTPKRNIKESRPLNSENARLQQVIEKLRLELQGRDAQLASLKAQHGAFAGQSLLQNEALKGEYQSKILRLETELSASKDDLKLIKERTSRELAHLMKKCLEFQQNQNRLCVKHDEIKASLFENELVTDIEYQRLKCLPNRDVSLQEFIKVRLYEITEPLKMKIKQQTSICNSLSGTLNAREKELDTLRQENTRKHSELKHAMEKHQNFVSYCDDVKSQLKSDDVRVLNYDRVKRERDQYESESTRLSKQNSELELLVSVLKKEKETIAEKLNELKSKLKIQEQDLLRYQTEYNDTRILLTTAREDVERHASRLKSEREKSDDLHNKYIKARSELVELKDSLQDRLNELSIMKEKYQSTSKREDGLATSLIELTRKHESLSSEFQFLESKYTNEVHLLKEELKDLRSNYSSVSKNYQFLLQENGELHIECQTAKTDLHKEKISLEKELGGAKRESSELKRLVSKYQALEREYSSAVAAFAAEPAGESSPASKGIPYPSCIRDKLSEETLTLTKEVLRLERENLVACTTIGSLTEALDQLRSKVLSYKSAIRMVSEPSSKLLSKITEQEEVIASLEAALNATEKSKKDLIEETDALRSRLNECLGKLREVHIQKGDFENLQEEFCKYQSFLHDFSEKNQRVKGKTNVLPKGITITKLKEEMKKS